MKEGDNKLMHENFFPIIQPTDMIWKLQKSISLVSEAFNRFDLGYVNWVELLWAAL